MPKNQNHGSKSLGKTFWILTIVNLSLFSCVPFKKTVLLHEPKEKYNTKIDSYESNFKDFKDYRLQPFDIIDLTFNEKDPNLKQLLETDINRNNFFNTPSGLYVNGFRINQDSTADIFNIGKLKLGGLTLEEAQNEVRKKLLEKYPYAEVNIKLVSFKISVLGEVNNPGFHFVFNEKFSLLDALSLAGGTSDYANSTRVKIIRNHGKQTQVYKINLSEDGIFAAENFYVWPHDIIYVEPLKSKPINTTFRQITPILSVISVLATVVNITALIITRTK